jgi:5-methyltetrahydrofolate--homocysteine methyltransferase
VRAGAEAGADLVLIETMNDTYEAKAAVLAAKENCGLPVCLTMTLDESGKLLTGGTMDAAVAMFEGLGVDAIGMNCGLGPEQMKEFAGYLADIASLPVIITPNAGLPDVVEGETVYRLGAREFAAHMKDIAGMGIGILGGCCGTTPEHISMTKKMCDGIAVRKFEAKQDTVVTSFSRTVRIGGRPVIIGERINPTGKRRFKEALRNDETEYIISQGIEQEEHGADILDVNVGLPEIDEAAMMKKVITALQGVTDLPLQLDTSDPEALEQGLRYYNGKALINSVNGKKESMEMVFPLVKKYGGVVVGLPLDESGIPDSAEGRIAVAEKIYETAAGYGIEKKDILIDGLAMAVSSDSRSAMATLGTLRGIRDRFGGKTILGVSNISFGLPRREIINSVFLTMAMEEGLSCAIINPNNEAMMRAVRAYMALTDNDPGFSSYIDAYADTTDDAVSGKAEKRAAAGNGGEDKPVSLAESVEKGLPERAKEAAASELLSREALDIIDEDLIPALDKVGKGFEAGIIFLPQLLRSADAAQAAFAVIREEMKSGPAETKGRIILATVKNDIHDIGKNIVKVMLENYGFDVVDLGKDVPPETIVECAVKEDIKLVGLSALMTTTVVSMEETIALLREKKADVKVIVGGAVMTPEYAERIGADAYAANAMETVRYAEEFYGSPRS